MRRHAFERDALSARFSWREAGLWTFAGAVVLSVYAGAALAVMRAPFSAEPPPAAQPTAIMIDLAPEPAAPPAPRPNMAKDAENSPEIAAEPQPEPEEPVEEPAPQEPEPLPEVPEPVVEEPQPEAPEPVVEAKKPLPEETREPEPVTPPLENVEVPVPIPRPAPPRPIVQAEKKQKQPEHKPIKRRQAPSKAAQKAAVEAPRAPVAAARQSSLGTRSSLTPARWQARLLAHLARHKRYPASARARSEEGTATVRFRIDAAGKVLSVAVTRSTGFADLDKEVVAMVRRSSPVPAPPPGVNRTIVVPVQFNLR